MKKDKILQTLNKLASKQSVTIQATALLTDPYKKEDDQWSAIQILEHIYLSQGGIYKYIKDKGLEQNVGKAGVKDRIKNLGLKFMLNGKNKFKAPKILPIPLNKHTPEELQKKFQVLNQSIQTFFESLPEEKLNKVVFKHPRAGKMDILAVVKFWSQHWHHHEQQLKAWQNG